MKKPILATKQKKYSTKKHQEIQDDNSVQHPSWQAKRKQKEAMSSANFAGRRIMLSSASSEEEDS